MENLRGSLFMVAAMAAFAVEDLFIKSAARSVPAGQVLALFGLFGMLGFAALARAQGVPALTPAILSRPLVLRSLCELTGRVAYTLAIALIPLSVASAILQATPLIVVGGAALLFGERVGWRRWSAIGLGFAGVLVILRPGLEGFTPAAVLAVIGTLGFAGRDLATRAAPRTVTNAQLGVVGFALLVPAGLGILAVTGGAEWPGMATWALIGLATGFGVVAYQALTLAMRLGEVAVVTPFRYTRLVFAMALGVVLLGERPDTLTITGSLMIVGSGLFTLLRGRRLARG